MARIHQEWSWLPSRIFIDSSYTATSGRCSGIERVVVSLQHQLFLIAHQYNACSQSNSQTSALIDSNRTELIPVISVDGSFIELGEKQKKRLDGPAQMRANLLAFMPITYDKVSSLLCSLIPLKIMRTWLRPEAGHLGIFKLPHNIYNRMARKSLALSGGKPEPQQGDLLILPDAYWGKTTVWKAAAKARKQGAKVAIVLYDLIPLTHPEFVGERRHKNFKLYLRNVLRHADIVMAISDTVRQQVVDLLDEYSDPTSAPPLVRAFTLGAEFNQRSGFIRTEIESLFTPTIDSNPYLMVATFDPRKNHPFLLDAFDRLWAKGSSEKLCFIGRVGSLCDDLMDRIDKHPEKNKKLFVFHDIQDGELQHCYRYSKGVISPSIVEGFGLPIIESLWHNKRTLVSDTPIHREVGGELCEYFSLAEEDSLVTLLQSSHKSSQQTAKSIGTYEIPTWSDSAKSFMESCLMLFEKPVRSSSRKAA